MADAISAETILDSIHYYRCHNQTELVAVLNVLPDYIKARPKIKLVVVDSIAFHFRADVIDVTGRNRALSTIASNLNQLAYNHKLAVVVMNHVTSKIVRSESIGPRGKFVAHDSSYMSIFLTLYSVFQIPRLEFFNKVQISRVRWFLLQH